MHARIQASLAVGALGMLSVSVLLWRPASESIAMQPAAPGEVRTIPLESCYATFGGNGCKYVSSGGSEPYGSVMEILFREHKGGASNVVLVRGMDFAAAVKAARWAFTSNHWADTPVLPDLHTQEAKGEPLWLVAYLGSGSSGPPRRQVQAVEVRGQTVRVTYSRTNPREATKDFIQYFVWVPLGQTKAGIYTLELFDADRKEVMLVRRVAAEVP